jgi:hypothetical protein
MINRLYAMHRGLQRWRNLMQRTCSGSSTAETRVGQVPVLFWLILIAAVAAVLLLTLSTVSFDGFDRLLRNGEPFAPYFTT